MSSLLQGHPPDDGAVVPVSEQHATPKADDSTTRSSGTKMKARAQVFAWVVGQSRKIAWGVIIGSGVGSAAAAVAGANPNLVPAASVIGVTVVALIAASEASSRQQRQLVFEAERQSEKFQHERDLNTIEDHRAVIDDSVALLSEATYRLRQVLMELRRGASPPDLAKATEAAFAAVRAIRRGGARLTVRFGSNHGLTTAYEAARDRVSRSEIAFRDAQRPATPLMDLETQRIARERALADGVEILLAAQEATDEFATRAAHVLSAT